MFKWVKDKKKIIVVVVIVYKKLLKIRLGNKYSCLFFFLMMRFKNVWLKGYGVDFNWFWLKVRVVYREFIGNLSVIVCKYVIIIFLKRYNIRMWVC